jgi:aryl-alcohol dehydrogenase-like predicted oxidoreductase
VRYRKGDTSNGYRTANGGIPWSPLAGEFFSGKYSLKNEKVEGARRTDFDFPTSDKEKVYDIIDVIATIGKQYDTSAAQIALACVPQRPGILSTIIGAKISEQLLDNKRSTEITLTVDELKKQMK